jgi:hypothetical protein
MPLLTRLQYAAPFPVAEKALLPAKSRHLL